MALLASSADPEVGSVEQEDMGCASSSTSASDSDEDVVFPLDIENNVSGQCNFCEKMLYIAELPIDKVTGHIWMPIGRVDDMLEANCPDHQRLLATFHDNLNLDEQTATSALFIRRDYWTSSFSFIHQASLHKVDNILGSTPQLDLLGGDNALGISLDLAMIDRRVITNWYQECIHGHGEKCARPQYLKLIPHARPEYLIDVVDNCLVAVKESEPVPPYAALSYVWGSVPMLRATNSNLAMLQKPGSLQPGANELPRTVWHAMYVTAELIPDLRYLWVDALCIAQDDLEMLHRHLPQMGSIYANAAIVITAASGDDAAYGLRGLSDAPMPVPRDLPEPTTLRLGKATLIQRRQQKDESSEDGERPRYFNRGWTFQEWFFARRSLLFDSRKGVSFHCCVSTMYEDHKKPGLSTYGDSVGRDFILKAGYPSLTVLSNIIGDFNKRELSFPQDCQLAFAGVIPCYRDIFSGGFVASMPAMFIDAVLLWQPAGKITRRLATASGTKQDGALPSWSWVGWQGPLDFAGWFAGNDFVAGCSGYMAQSDHQVVSTTEWSVCDEPNNAAKRVRCLWTEWRERYKDESVQLPVGWSKRLRQQDEDPFARPPQGYGTYVYQYQGSPNPTFWYPIPLTEDHPLEVDTPATNLSNDAYLCGRVGTISANMMGPVRHIEHQTFEDVTTHHCICLGDDRGQWIGVLRLPSEDYLDQKGISQGAEVQLIAISEGFIPNGKKWTDGFIDEYDMEERPQRDGKEQYKFVNVLWITWNTINGQQVAHRQALGRVAKVYWEKSAPRTRDVVLG